MNVCDFFKCHPNYTVVKIILKVLKIHQNIVTLVSGQNRAHKTATIKTARTQPRRTKPRIAQNCVDLNRTGHNRANNRAHQNRSGHKTDGLRLQRPVSKINQQALHIFPGFFIVILINNLSQISLKMIFPQKRKSRLVLCVISDSLFGMNFLTMKVEISSMRYFRQLIWNELFF